MVPGLKWIAIVAGVVAALFALDRLLLAAEARGFIYWRRRRGSSGSLASALLEVHSHLQPSARHVVEEQRRVVEEDDDEGAPPAPPT